MTFDVETAYNELRARLSQYPQDRRNLDDRVRLNELLARHCTFGVGGPADIWVTVDTANALVELVTICSQRRWPLLIIGNGTNVLYADAGVRGIVARIALNTYSIEEEGNDSARLIAGAGVSWPRLLNEVR